MALQHHPTHVETARRLAVASAWVSAGLYMLIGIGVLPVGESASGGDPGLLGFGALMAVVFAVAALLLMRFRSAILWVAVVVLQLMVLVGYAAFAGYRLPPFEPWGLIVKLDQVVLLAATVYLLVRGRGHAAAPAPGPAA